MTQTLTELFSSARLLAGIRKSYTHYFTELIVAGVEYHGTLKARKGGEHRQGRDKWKAEIYLRRSDSDKETDFHGYGATGKEALGDMENAVQRWAESEEVAG